jgi:hypothetical protein
MPLPRKTMAKRLGKAAKSAKVRKNSRPGRKEVPQGALKRLQEKVEEGEKAAPSAAKAEFITKQLWTA